MQSSKPSKKTSKQANETIAPAQELAAAADVTVKPRASRSSKTKKSEPAETGTVKHHHKSTPSVVAEHQAVEFEIQATAAPREVTHIQISERAYAYWLAGGCMHGAAESDWLKAERELLEAR